MARTIPPTLRTKRALSVLGLLGLLTVAGPVLDASAASPQGYYVALGDSYSSGEGLTPYPTSPTGCSQSPLAYPELVQRTLRFTKLFFEACPGATTAQVESQVAHVSPAVWKRTRLVTITAGGNDLPFFGLITACTGAVASAQATSFLYLTNVSSASICETAISRAATLLGTTIDAATGTVERPRLVLAHPLTHPSALERRLRNLYVRVLRAEGVVKDPHSNARVVIVQYPNLIGARTNSYCLLSSSPLHLKELPKYNGKYLAFTPTTSAQLLSINTYLQAETGAVVRALKADGIRQISLGPLTNSFAPLDCANGASPDLNGFLVNALTSNSAQGSFHPTAAGQSQMASSVLAAWRH